MLLQKEVSPLPRIESKPSRICANFVGTAGSFYLYREAWDAACLKGGVTARLPNLKAELRRLRIHLLRRERIKNQLGMVAQACDVSHLPSTRYVTPVRVVTLWNSGDKRP